MKDKLLIMEQKTLIDYDGFYEIRKWYYDSEEKKIFCRIESRNTESNQFEKLSWTRELSKIETEKFLKDNQNREFFRYEIKKVIRDLKISNLIS